MWETSGILNESDVEQKLLYPLLTVSQPAGLGFPQAVIQTKVSIRRLAIGKGAEQKLYFPDYVVVTLGYPLLVVEAKHPNESLDEGYREARLYAQELNALYPHSITPTKYVVASNGVELWYGFADQAVPKEKVLCTDLGIYSGSFSAMLDLIGWDKISAHAEHIARTQRPTALFKPRRLLGGLAFQNEEIDANSFGTTVTSAISNVFNPERPEDRRRIVRDAYVPSRRRERYIDPIDKIIRAARPPSETNATLLDDTSRPEELINKLRAPSSLEHKVLLLIGSVGSGKSTFIDYLQEVALPKELMSSTVWCRLNMNLAPVSPGEIYSWLRKEVISSCRDSLPDLDFDSLDIIQKLYGTEIARFTKGVGKLYESQSDVYKIKLAEHIESIQRDPHVVANAHIRYTCGERHRLCIIVLDNCDKKTRDEQLLMFEAAQWLQKEFRCLVILPLRDETYDNHKDQPPLDTALKDMVFRIEPPMFQQVLMRRVQVALRDLGEGGNDKLHFLLPNGFEVEYPKSDQAYYLTSIVKSLFEHDLFARRLIVGLAGRNMRKALEIFLEFCSSGYIGSDLIFKIRQSEGNYALPFHQVATVILRLNRRFYDSDHSYIRNVFAAGFDDVRPAFFSRYMIMRWLRNNFRSEGTAGLRGYFPKRVVKQALIPYGLSPEVIDREFNYLLSGHCVVAEHLRTDQVADEDLVRLGPAGFVHLELVSNVNYLAAIAEDTYFEDKLQAERIASRIRPLDSHLHIRTALDNAREVVSYLDGVRGRIAPPEGVFMKEDLLTNVADFNDAHEALERVSRSHANDPWFDADKRMPRGSRKAGVVQNNSSVGYFVEFSDGLVGLVHKTKINGILASPGDRVEVEVLWVDLVQRKMGLKLMAVLEEDAGDQVDGTHDSVVRD